MDKLGLIAGNGTFPQAVARAAHQRGIEVVAVAHLNETLPELEPLCDHITWIKVGELQKIIEAFSAAGIRHAAMAGGIDRKRLYDSFTPDARAMAMLARIGRFNDDAVLRGVAAELEAEGLEVIDPVFLLDQALARRGTMAGPAPTPAQLKDVELAFSLMHALGPYDVGQAVAVKAGVVAAVEAVEGTDAAFRRAAALCGRGLVLAKAAKPGQDLRFDRPTVGPHTVELLVEIGAALLALQERCILVLDPELTLPRAAEAGVTIYGHGA